MSLPQLDRWLAPSRVMHAPEFAVAGLEGLALKDGDPRSRPACAAPLATLCAAARRGTLAAGDSSQADGGGSGAAAAGMKALAQLPPDGALRPLLASLLEGQWVLPGQFKLHMDGF
jgi:hypothetical protein